MEKLVIYISILLNFWQIKNTILTEKFVKTIFKYFLTEKNYLRILIDQQKENNNFIKYISNIEKLFFYQKPNEEDLKNLLFESTELCNFFSKKLIFTVKDDLLKIKENLNPKNILSLKDDYLSNKKENLEKFYKSIENYNLFLEKLILIFDTENTKIISEESNNIKNLLENLKNKKNIENLQKFFDSIKSSYISSQNLIKSIENKIEKAFIFSNNENILQNLKSNYFGNENLITENNENYEDNLFFPIEKNNDNPLDLIDNIFKRDDFSSILNILKIIPINENLFKDKKYKEFFIVNRFHEYFIKNLSTNGFEVCKKIFKFPYCPLYHIFLSSNDSENFKKNENLKNFLSDFISNLNLNFPLNLTEKDCNKFMHINKYKDFFYSKNEDSAKKSLFKIIFLNEVNTKEFINYEILDMFCLLISKKIATL